MMEKIEERASFAGVQEVYKHASRILACEMRFGVYLPPQIKDTKCPVLYWLSGLTCTEQNFVTKAAAQQFAAQHGVVLVAPDTSPRGDDIPDVDSYDFGVGAGFYLNATEEPWAKNYRMYDYLLKELFPLVERAFPVSSKRSIFGHSMGGHGALIVALKNPGLFKSVSAFSPIVAPSVTPWGIHAFSKYLGDDRSSWKEWDACELVREKKNPIPLWVDQGEADDFLKEQLQTERLKNACEESGHPLELRMLPGYDHSFYFIATFIGEHIAYHATHLFKS